MAIRVTLECGHASMLRVRTTPQGYTHDWEVFVRGVDNADISQYVDKVVFHLHETFPKPKRVLKEPPYLVKESGYAGFVIPIDVYLRNKDEPKRIQISYDLILQPSGPAFNNVIRHNEVFANPSEEFRKKLLKGGGISVSGGSEEPGDRGDYKMVPPMVSKPKLSGSEGSRKHRTTDVRSSNSFADLFGNPMTLPAKVSPETKRPQASADKLPVGAAAGPAAAKASPADKTEKSEKPTKPKHSPHKDKKKERSAEERKDRRDKTVGKDKERAKEKSKRPGSPAKEEPAKRPPTVNLPAPVTPTATATATTTTTTTTTPGSPAKKTGNLQESPKSKERDHKKPHVDREKPKDAFKVPIEDRKFDRKKKKHKDERSKDRSKDQERPKEASKKAEKKLPKPEKAEKSLVPAAKEERKSPKHHQKERGEKLRGEKASEDSKHPKEARPVGDRDKQRHKHKRKDRKERGEDPSLEKDTKKPPGDKKPTYGASSPASNLTAERDSDSAHSLDEESAPKSFAKSEAPEPAEAKTSSPSRLTLEPKLDNEDRTKRDARNAKIGRGEERDSRRRKRKLAEVAGQDEQQHSIKRPKERSASPSVEPVSSSQSPISSDLDSRFNYKETTTANQLPPSLPAQPPIANEPGAQPDTEQVAPDSTNNALVEPENDAARSVFSDDYVTQLKELQQKIMTLQDNQELQRVVQVIAETGQYEITKKTFDFDLCALDRRTVLRLQQFFSTS